MATVCASSSVKATDQEPPDGGHAIRAEREYCARAAGRSQPSGILCKINHRNQDGGQSPIIDGVSSGQTGQPCRRRFLRSPGLSPGGGARSSGYQIVRFVESAEIVSPLNTRDLGDFRLAEIKGVRSRYWVPVRHAADDALVRHAVALNYRAYAPNLAR